MKILPQPTQIRLLDNVYATAYILLDGTIVFSGTSLAKAIGEDDISSRRFLKSKWLKRKQDKGLSYRHFSVEVQTSFGAKTITAFDIPLASQFFLYRSFQNDMASVIVDGMLTTSLETTTKEQLGLKIVGSFTDRMNETTQKIYPNLSSLVEALKRDSDHSKRMTAKAKKSGHIKVSSWVKTFKGRTLTFGQAVSLGQKAAFAHKLLTGTEPKWVMDRTPAGMPIKVYLYRQDQWNLLDWVYRCANI